MSFSSSLKTMLAATSLLAVSTWCALPAAATPIQHNGSIFAASNGVQFSFIHTSTGGGYGSIIGGNDLSGSAQLFGDVSYTWETSGGPFGPGTTITFDQGPTTVFNNGTFVLDLWTSPSVLTVGSANAAHGSIEGVEVTHDIGGTINFTIRQIAGDNIDDELSDTFDFDVNMVMMAVNGIGSAGGSPPTFNTYLWGDTGEFEIGSCTSGNCSEIVALFYASHGLGIDLAFSGTSVPEPTAMALFGIGLLGLGVARRRRRALI